jgi:hypothetical protein
VWAGDGVHLTSPAYRVAARLLAAELERSVLGEAGEPATKRPRLESVVPAPAPPPAKPVFKALPPTPKPGRCGCPVSSPQAINTATAGTPGMVGTTAAAAAAAAEEEGAMEGALAEAAAAAAASTSLCVEKAKIKRSESTSKSPMLYLVNVEKVSS